MILDVGGIQNLYQGDFGEQWLEAVAAGCEFLHGRATTLDLEKADVELVDTQPLAGASFPTVKAQVKTTISTPRLDQYNRSWLYDLDAKTYNALATRNHVPRVLVVFWLPDPANHPRLDDVAAAPPELDHTRLHGFGSWVSLYGQPLTSDTKDVRVRLPVDNRLDASSLERMIRGMGVPRSTPTQVEFSDRW